MYSDLSAQACPTKDVALIVFQDLEILMRKIYLDGGTLTNLEVFFITEDLKFSVVPVASVMDAIHVFHPLERYVIPVE